MEKPKILLIEDTDAVREVLVRQLEALGAVATALVDGSDVKRALSQTQYQLVIADLQLPDCSGIDIARFAHARGCKIVLLTGYHDALSRPDIRDAGFDRVLEKPLTLEGLQNLLIDYGLIEGGAMEASQAVGYSLNEVLDIDSIRDQMGELDESALLMLSCFPAMMRGMVDKIDEASQEGNSLKVSELAHSLKGAARSAGAVRLAHICNEVQDLAQTGQNVDNFLPRVKEEFQRAEDALILLCA